MSSNAAKKRKPRQGAQRFPNIYEAVRHFDLERKLIDICIAKAQVPALYREDAAQEIRIAWLNLACKSELSMGEIASYAHRAGFHAALKLRRELGSATRLPGSAFRKRKDGETYVQPGHLAPPVPWDTLAEVLKTDDEDSYKESIPHIRRVSLLELIDAKAQREGIPGYTPLSENQRQIVALVTEGLSFPMIEEKLGQRHNTLLRNVREILKRVETLKELGYFSKSLS